MGETIAEAWLRERREEGRLINSRQNILMLGEHLGEPNEEITQALEQITDLERLQALLRRVTQIQSWDELLTPSDDS